MNISEIFESFKHSYTYWSECAKLDFATEIFEIMERKSISKSELANKLGVSPAYITKALSGSMNLSIESMAKFSYALGCKIDISLPEIEQTISTKNGSEIFTTAKNGSLLHIWQDNEEMEDSVSKSEVKQEGVLNGNSVQSAAA